MIIEIYDKNGTYVKSVEGNETQCLANVADDETYIEVQSFRNTAIYNTNTYLKNIKLSSVNSITVTTSAGKVFDGDEKSQDRMLRAINIAEISGLNSTIWKLADNSIVEVTLEELKEALSLAGQEMSRIWLS